MHSGYSVRTAGIEDILEIARVHVDCWKTTYIGIVPDEKLDGMSYEKSYLKWKAILTEFPHPVCSFLVAEKNGRIIGFCSGGKIRKLSKRTEGYEGEIKAIYILKEHQKKGIGKKFIGLYEEIFSKNNIFSYIIWVLKDNDSKNFYKKLGGKLITTKTYEIGGKKLKGLCFGFKISNGEGQ